MPGKRTPESASFITPRTPYRENVAAADSVGVQDSGIPLFDTSPAPSRVVGLGQSDVNQYGGWNGQINLAVIIKGFTSIDMELWLKAENENVELTSGSSSSSSAAPDLPSTGEWVLVETKTCTRSALWIVKSVPPGKYKVRVAGATGTGAIQIREQHAA
jgi:hypothetical protein